MFSLTDYPEFRIMSEHSKIDPGPQDVAGSSYTYIDGFNNHILGKSDHAAIYHGEGNTILNSPWTQIYHSHHVIVEGGEKMTLHSLSYVHVTPDGHRPLNQSDWEALTKRVRGIVDPIQIGKDGRCTCNVIFDCPLGRVGHMSRCTEAELQAESIPTERHPN